MCTNECQMLCNQNQHLYIQRVLWLNCVSPKRRLQVLTPSPLECDLIWQQYLCRCNQIKVKSRCIRVDPKPMTSILVRRGEFGPRDEHQREEHHVKMEAQGELEYLQTKVCQQPPEAAKRQGSIVPYSLQKGHSPTNTRSQNSSLQNCERITFCCLNHSVGYSSSKK